MKYVKLNALAKINIGLDVIGRRENGYHDVRMIMQTIYLYDDVTITRGKGKGISMSTNLYYLPNNENNIAYKAAKLLMDEFQIEEGIEIQIKKRIPVAAGLAGGSANAAAVLYGMNRLFQLKLSTKELMERGVKLGADVPYCIMRGTVLAEGIGEKLTALPEFPKCHILIAKPGISVSTKTVYDKLDSKEIVEHPDIDSLLNGIKKGDLDEIVAHMGNVLELVTEDDYPIIKEIKDVMVASGAKRAMMSGSGPTVFGIYTERKLAKAAMKELKERGIAKQVFVTNVHNIRRNRNGNEF